MVAAMIELVDVWKRFGERVAVQPLSLEVRPAETVVLLGTSGSGKSTLMRLMSGLARPDAGQVLFEGRPLRADPTFRRRMGYMTQDGGLFPHLTARANVALQAVHLGWARAQIDARMHELASAARLPSAALDAYPAQLSGGQRQRVSLMRALFLQPAVLMLDEPLGALDPITRVELQEELRALVQRLATTTVLVTHDLAEAAFFAGSIVLMHEGAIQQRGPLRELLEAPANDFVARFIGAYRSAASRLVERA